MLVYLPLMGFLFVCVVWAIDTLHKKWPRPQFKPIYYKYNVRKQLRLTVCLTGAVFYMHVWFLISAPALKKKKKKM